jgi:glutamate-ammonia-ligase adenylyltransferase
VQALTVLSGHGLLAPEEAGTLIDAYLFCTRARLRLHLQMGRPVDSLPADRNQLRSLASSLGFDRSSELREEYRRVTRRARQIFEHRFF